MNEKKAGIIMVNYNMRENIKNVYYEYIQGSEHDLVVVDNSSDSDLSKWCEDTNASYIDTGENIGYAGANNKGIKETLQKYDYFWILNPDTEITDPGILESMIATMEQHSNLGVLAPRILDQYGSEYDLPSRFEDILRRMNVLPDLLADSDPLLYTDHVPGSAMLLRREMIEQIGFLDERFFLYVEETEYCYRARQHGYDVAIHRGSQIIHREQESALKHNEDYQVYYRSRNRFLLARMRFIGLKKRLYYILLIGFYIFEASDIAKDNPRLFIPMILGIADGINGKFGRRRYLNE